MRYSLTKVCRLEIKCLIYPALWVFCSKVIYNQIVQIVHSSITAFGAIPYLLLRFSFLPNVNSQRGDSGSVSNKDQLQLLGRYRQLRGVHAKKDMDPTNIQKFLKIIRIWDQFIDCSRQSNFSYISYNTRFEKSEEYAQYSQCR